MKKTSQNLVLSDDHIVATIDKLQLRIADRFPNSGLAQLCKQLHQVSRDASEFSDQIRRPILWIRISGYVLAAALIALIGGVLVYALQSVRFRNPDMSVDSFIQTFDAAASGGLFIGAAIYYLVNLEKRIKRHDALSAVHELRSIAHIIDMHQLTKDPERLFGNYRGTDNSPVESMTPLQLGRYLDYCTEMLSLNGKIAALYVSQFDDSEVIAAVSEIEQLCTGLSRKIWQKIMVLNRHRTMTITSEDQMHAESLDATVTNTETSENSIDNKE